MSKMFSYSFFCGMLQWFWPDHSCWQRDCGHQWLISRAERNWFIHGKRCFIMLVIRGLAHMHEQEDIRVHGIWCIWHQKRSGTGNHLSCGYHTHHSAVLLWPWRKTLQFIGILQLMSWPYGCLTQTMAAVNIKSFHITELSHCKWSRTAEKSNTRWGKWLSVKTFLKTNKT